ncbi:AAA family ATPase [Serratia sp. NA_112.1]|uniref:AAA family ATPase n=1 Tax=unclassified Serratia (in: enterobacteria) TaxID=2647522 RepID=UPI004046D7FF
MKNHSPSVLHMMCGKAGSGKSTIAHSLAQQPQTLLMVEDNWLATLYEQQMATLQDYVHYSARLREVLSEHIVQLLRNGLSVVLDFPMNTPDRRLWARQLAERAGVDHCLHFIDVSDALCKSRIKLRNEQGDHPFTLSEETFDLLTQYFVPPAEEECLSVIRYS